METFDILSPQVSVVSHDLGGKTFMIYGSNRLGKTKQLCSGVKPCYLAFEDGLNAIGGVPFFQMDSWSKYVQFVKQACDPEKIALVKEKYQTIIIDQVEAMGDLCGQYICNKFGLKNLGEKKYIPGKDKVDFGFSGYTELKLEFNKWQRLMLAAGYTIFYIDHETTRDEKDEAGETYTKIYPRGNKGIIDSICDAVDTIGRVVPNGRDENGNEIKSSLLLTNTRGTLAGSRFTYLTPFLQEFTLENLTNAVKDAIEAETKASGHQSVNFQTQRSTHEVKPSRPFEEVKADIGVIAKKLFEAGREAEYKAIIQEYLGVGNGVMESTPEKAEQLALVLFDLQKLTL